MVFFKLLLVANVFAFALASPLDRTDDIDGKIVGGYVTTIEKNPWQVSLQNGGHYCGGSIIGEKWVLSAAHCSANSVRVGSSFHARGGSLVRVKQYIRHEKYSSQNGDFDYALLELAEPLNFTRGIKSIALPDGNAKIDDGTLALVSGWGATHNSSESNYQLRAARVPIVNQDVCKKQYSGFTYEVSDRMICAGLEQGGKDSCQGDSGGPLIEFETGVPKLIGIVSWGRGCALPNYSGVYARVTAAREWIKLKSGI